jgi:4-hydroxyacetophenone monooxygenase
LWSKDGARAYLGTLLPGFPNFFMIYGPNTNANVGFAITHMQEIITRFALECMAALITRDMRSVEVTPEAYWRYNDALDVAAARKVYSDSRSHSYFKNEFGRCATNAAFDGRLMWHWLRDPARSEVTAERLPEHLRETSQIVGPFFGQDLILST